MLLQALIDNINRRFPKDTNNILHVFSVLSPRALSSAGAGYGRHEIETWHKHYGGEQVLIDKEQTMVEWSHLKDHVKIQQYPTRDLFI